MVRETRHLWVGNLPDNISEEKILEHFKRYGRVQSVKFLSKNKDDEVNANSLCATIAFIDIKSASKAHSGDNKVDERTLKTQYYEPSLPSTASSAIHIHERNESLTRPPATGSSQSGHYVRTGSGSRYSHGIVDDRGYDRSSSGGHYYLDRNKDPYSRRSGSSVSYHDDEVYQSRGRPRERYSRGSSGVSSGYGVGIDRNQGLYRTHNSRQHYDSVQRYSSEQYLDERLSRRSQVQSLCSVSSTSPRSNSGSRGRNRHRKQRRSSPVNSTASKSRSPSVGSQSPGSVSVGSRSLSRGRSRSSGSRSRSRSSSSSSGHRKRSRSSSSSRSSSRSRSRSRHSRSPSVSSNSRGICKGSNTGVNTVTPLTSPPVSGTISSSASLLAGIASESIRPAGSVQQDSVCSTPEHCSTGTTTTSTENTTTAASCCTKTLAICVKNLPVRSSDSSLKDGLFHEYKKHGKVTTVKVIGQGIDRYAVVCFKKSDDVEKSLEVSKDKLFFGCKIDVTPYEGLDAEDNEFRPLEAQLDEFHPKATRTLFIGNLEKETCAQELRSHFEPFGEIIEIDIKKQGSTSSYAFIQYSDICAVTKAMRKLDGEHLGANRINLGFGKSMPTNCVWLDGLSDTVTEKFLSRQLSRFGPVTYTVIDKQLLRALVFFEATEYAQAALPELKGRSVNTKKVQNKNAFNDIIDESRMKVDFASRECQVHFFEKLKSSGQMVAGDHLWEVYSRRSQEFDPRDERFCGRDPRLPFEPYNHTGNYNRYDNPPQRTSSTGNLGGNINRNRLQRGRATQSSGGRFDHDDLDRRHQSYDENISPDMKNMSDHDQDVRDHGFSQKRDTLSLDSMKCKTSPRLPSSVSPSRSLSSNQLYDKYSHYDSSDDKGEQDTDRLRVKCPPRYRSQHDLDNVSPMAGQCLSPLSTKDKRGLSPDSQHNSVHVSSPCGIDPAFDYIADLPKRRYTSVDLAKIDLNNELERSGKKYATKHSLDSTFLNSKHRKLHSLDATHPCSRSDLSDHLERKKRLLLAVRDRTPVRTKDLSVDHFSDDLVNSMKRSENGLSDTDADKCELKVKPKSECSANTDLKHLQKEKVHLLHLLEQLDDGAVSSSDHENNENDGESRKERRSKLMRTKLGDLGLVVSCQHDPMPLRKEPIVISAEYGVKNHSSDLVDPRIGRWKYHERLLSPSFSLTELLKPLSNCDRLKRPPLERALCKTDDDDDGRNVSTADLLMKWRRKSNHSTNDSKNANIVHKPALHAIKSPSEPGYRLVTNVAKKQPMSLPLPQFATEWLSNHNNVSKSVLQDTSPKLKSPSSLSPPHAISSSPEFRPTKPKPPLLIACDKKINSNPSILVSPPTKESADKLSLNLMSPPKPSLLSPPVVANVAKPKDAPDSSSDSEQSSSSPNRPSFEERIRALDEKFNAWFGSTRNATPNTPTTTPAAVEPVADQSKKRTRFNFLTTSDIRKEPSDIMKSLLAKSSIFDQDSKRLEHINEKYEPKEVNHEMAKPIIPKPFVRTKAAAKQFSVTTAADMLPTNTSPSLSPPPTPKAGAPAAPQPVLPPPIPPYSPLTPVSATEPPPPPPSLLLRKPDSILKKSSDSSAIPSSQHSETADQSIFQVPQLHDVPEKSPPDVAASPPEPVKIETKLVDSNSKIKDQDDVIKESREKTLPLVAVERKKSSDSLLIQKPEPILKPINNVCGKSLKHSSEDSRRNSSDGEVTKPVEPVKKVEHIKREPEFLESSVKKEFKAAKHVKSETVPCTSIKQENHKPESVKRKISHDSHKSLKIDFESKSEPEAKKSKINHHSSSKERKHSGQSKSRPEKDKKPLLKLSSKSSSDRPRHESSSDKVKHDSGNDRDRDRPRHDSNKSKTISKERSSSDHKSKIKSSSDGKSERKHSSDPSKKKFKEKSRNESGKSKKEKEPKELKEKEPKEWKEKEPKELKEKELKEWKEKETKELKEKELKEWKEKEPKEWKEKEPKELKEKEPKEWKETKKPREPEEPKESKDKSSKNVPKKVDPDLDKFPFHLLDDDEPIYFSMYDKVKARSSHNQNVKDQSKDLDYVRKKFNKLKATRAKREDKIRSGDYDSSHQFSDEMSDISDFEEAEIAHKLKKRKFVIESSSDSDASTTRHRLRKNKSDYDMSSCDSSDLELRRRSTLIKKQKTKVQDIYDSDSSDDNKCLLIVETESKGHMESMDITEPVIKETKHKPITKMSKIYFSDSDNSSDEATKSKSRVPDSSDSDHVKDHIPHKTKDAAEPRKNKSKSRDGKHSSRPKKSASKPESDDGSIIQRHFGSSESLSHKSMEKVEAVNQHINLDSDITADNHHDTDEDVFLSMPIIESMKADAEKPIVSVKPDSHKKSSHKKKKEHRTERHVASKKKKSSKIKVEKEEEPAMPILEKANDMSSPTYQDLSPKHEESLPLDDFEMTISQQHSPPRLPFSESAIKDEQILETESNSENWNFSAVRHDNIDETKQVSFEKEAVEPEEVSSDKHKSGLSHGKHKKRRSKDKKVKKSKESSTPTKPEKPKENKPSTETAIELSFSSISENIPESNTDSLLDKINSEPEIDSAEPLTIDKPISENEDSDIYAGLDIDNAPHPTDHVAPAPRAVEFLGLDEPFDTISKDSTTYEAVNDNKMECDLAVTALLQQMDSETITPFIKPEPQFEAEQPSPSPPSQNDESMIAIMNMEFESSSAVQHLTAIESVQEQAINNIADKEDAKPDDDFLEPPNEPQKDAPDAPEPLELEEPDEPDEEAKSAALLICDEIPKTPEMVKEPEPEVVPEEPIKTPPIEEPIDEPIGSEFDGADHDDTSMDSSLQIDLDVDNKRLSSEDIAAPETKAFDLDEPLNSPESEIKDEAPTERISELCAEEMPSADVPSQPSASVAAAIQPDFLDFSDDSNESGQNNTIGVKAVASSSLCQLNFDEDSEFSSIRKFLSETDSDIQDSEQPTIPNEDKPKVDMLPDVKVEEPAPADLVVDESQKDEPLEATDIDEKEMPSPESMPLSKLSELVKEEKRKEEMQKEMEPEPVIEDPQPATEELQLVIKEPQPDHNEPLAIETPVEDPIGGPPKDEETKPELTSVAAEPKEEDKLLEFKTSSDEHEDHLQSAPEADDHSDGGLKIVDESAPGQGSDSTEEVQAAPRTRSRTADPKTRRSRRTRGRKVATRSADERTPAPSRVLTRRSKPAAVEKVRRSLRVDMNDSVPAKAAPTTPKDAETKQPQQEPIDDPKKRKGRRKKISETGSVTPPQAALVPEAKEEVNRSSANQKSGVYDVFEFRDSEDEDFGWDPAQHHPVHKEKAEVPMEEESTEKPPPPPAPPTPASAESDVQKISTDSKHGKISITIRLPPKDNVDGSFSGAPEVVKTSDGGRPIEEGTAESEPDKIAEAPQPEPSVEPQVQPAAVTPAKGHVRKSQRLLSKNTVDDIIEDVVKGNFVESSESQTIVAESSVIRSTRSRTRSKTSKNDLAEPAPAAPVTRSKSPKSDKGLDTAILTSTPTKVAIEPEEDKEPKHTVPVIETPKVEPQPEEAAKVPELIESPKKEAKVTDDELQDPGSPDDRLIINESPQRPAEPEPLPDISPKASAPTIQLQSPPPSAADEDLGPDKVDNKVSLRSFRISRGAIKHEDKLADSIDVAKPKEESEAAVIPMQPCGPPPVMKVELPKVAPGSLPARVKSAKELGVERTDDNERSSPVVLIDPVTGYLMPVNKPADSALNKSSPSIPPPPLHTVAVTDSVLRHATSASGIVPLKSSVITPKKSAHMPEPAQKKMSPSTQSIASVVQQPQRLMVPPPPPLLRKTSPSALHLPTSLVSEPQPQHSIAQTTTPPTISNTSKLVSVTVPSTGAVTPVGMLSPNLPQQSSAASGHNAIPKESNSSIEEIKLKNIRPPILSTVEKQHGKVVAGSSGSGPRGKVTGQKPIAGFEQGMAPPSAAGAIGDFHVQNPQYLQQHYQEMYAAAAHHRATPGAASPGATLIRPNTPTHPTPPHTPPNIPNAQDGHVAFRQPNPIVAPHLMSRHPSDINAYVHQHMMYSPYQANMQAEVQARIRMGQPRVPFAPAATATATRTTDSESRKLQDRRTPIGAVASPRPKDSRSPALMPDLQQMGAKMDKKGALVMDARAGVPGQHHMVDVRNAMQSLAHAQAMDMKGDARAAMHDIRHRKPQMEASHQFPVSVRSADGHLTVETRPEFHHVASGSSLHSSQFRQLSPHIHQPRASDSPVLAPAYHQQQQQPRFVSTPHQQRSIGASLLATVPPDKNIQQPPPAHQASNLHRKTANKVSKPKYVYPELDQASGMHGAQLAVMTTSKPSEVIGNAIPGMTSVVPPPAHAPSHIKQHPSRPQPQTPPAASQVPPQGDSLLTLLQQFPVIWQGLLALKNDQAVVQMHFISGNHDVGAASLPVTSDGITPPLRIVQRMRLEQTQLEGVARRMQMEREHCMLLALPYGRDQIDVLQQSSSLHSGFISYLQQKQAAGIVNVAPPGSTQAAYVVHIFPSCEFSCEVLARVSPDLVHSISEIAHLLIIVATV